jgi:hypothetical protein
VKKCDLGILLGGPILEKEFNELISIINSHVKDEEKVNCLFFICSIGIVLGC